jgi:hypothetical protein
MSVISHLIARSLSAFAPQEQCRYVVDGRGFPFEFPAFRGEDGAFSLQAAKAPLQN